MYKIKVLTIGKCKDSWLDAAIADYARRLRSQLSIEWRLAKSDEQLDDLLSKEPHYVALDPQGKLFDSLVFANWLESTLVKTGGRLLFVIGGSDGLTEMAKKRASELISLSPLTFTHQLTRLILFEQFYRALEIKRGSPYHK